MGGRNKFNIMLDSIFSLPPVFDESYYNSVIHEIREMQVMDMGNYAHGNQPVQHVAYLYNYSGEPWKSQYWIREILQKLYSSNPDGYCGDEDNGQTSAWYVFSALGFYPVCPGSNQYVIGSPLFKNARINLENGKSVEISAYNNNSDNRYVSAISLNGISYDRNYITHGDLTNGAKIKYKMSAVPNKNRGVSEAAAPYSFSDELGKL